MGPVRAKSAPSPWKLCNEKEQEKGDGSNVYRKVVLMNWSMLSRQALYWTLLSGLDGRGIWLNCLLLDVSPPSVCSIFRSSLTVRWTVCLKGQCVILRSVTPPPLLLAMLVFPRLSTVMLPSKLNSTRQGHWLLALLKWRIQDMVCLTHLHAQEFMPVYCRRTRTFTIQMEMGRTCRKASPHQMGAGNNYVGHLQRQVKYQMGRLFHQTSRTTLV